MTRSNPVHSPPARIGSSKLQLPASCDPPTLANLPQQRVWIIFGGSGHIGRSVLKAALSHGDIVTAVGKLHEDTIESMARLAGPPPASPARPQPIRSPSRDPPPASNPKHHHPHPRYLPLVCDVRLPASVAAVVNATLERWGRFDIVANCSGYGVIGACEDQDDADIRGQLETNFFGTLHIIQATLPYFRKRGAKSEMAEDSSDESATSGDEGVGEGEEADAESSQPSRSETSNHQKLRGGRYLVFSSTSGALGVPGLGPYCATKYAVEGLIESLLYEVDTFGIRATLVEPGHVRRDDFLGDGDSSGGSTPTRGGKPAATSQSNSTSPASSSSLPTFGHFLIKPPSQPYATINSPASHARRVVQWLGDHQPTSAVKAAELVWQLGHCRFPPLRLLLGSYAVESVRDRLRTIIEEIENWKYLNFGAQGGGAQEPRTKRDMNSGDEEDRDDKKQDEDQDEEMEDEGVESEDGDEEDTTMNDPGLEADEP